LSATPKHFSLWADVAASISAFVKGAANEAEASAVVTALASSAVVTLVLTDMKFSNRM
jgi:hypothetical protein